MKQNICLGIDIGGSKIRGVLWDGKRVLASFELITPRSLRAFRRELTLLAARLSQRARRKIRSIGIGAAGVIQGTRIAFSPNIPYLRRFNFRSLFPFGRLRVDNDARCFLRAEWIAGVARGARRPFAFTLGTGIGRAYGRGGNVMRLKRFEYPEVWERQYQHIRDDQSGAELASFLGEKLSKITRRYRPDALVLGGGVLARPRFFQKLKIALHANGVRGRTVRAHLGKDSAAIGAALLFQNEDHLLGISGS